MESFSADQSVHLIYKNACEELELILRCELKIQGSAHLSILKGSLEKAVSVIDVRQLLIKSEHLLQGVPLIVPEISSMPSNIIIPCLLFALAYVCFGSTYPVQRVTLLVTAHLL